MNYFLFGLLVIALVGLAAARGLVGLEVMADDLLPGSTITSADITNKSYDKMV